MATAETCGRAPTGSARTSASPPHSPCSRRGCRPTSSRCIPEGLAQGDPPAHEGPARQLRPRHPPLAHSRPARLRRQRPTSLEGFLFPATYELKKGQPRHAPARASSSRTSSATSTRSTSATRSARTSPRTTCSSSLRSSSARRWSQRSARSFASVIYNRLHDDIRLDIDATTRFAVGNWKRPLELLRAFRPEPVQHARAPGAAARADRQPRARVDTGPRPTPRRRAICSTSSSRAPAGSTTSPRPTPSFRAT